MKPGRGGVSGRDRGRGGDRGGVRGRSQRRADPALALAPLCSLLLLGSLLAALLLAAAGAHAQRGSGALGGPGVGAGPGAPSGPGVLRGPGAVVVPAPWVVRDDSGTTHRIDAAPRRIVSMLPSLTESVAALGAGARLVGVDRYSNWPAEVAQLPHLGGLDDAQIEAIVALEPDLVLASTSSRAMERLQALGLRVLRLKSESHADVQRSLLLLAQVLGQPEAGPRLWSRIEDELAEAATRVPAALRGRAVYFEIGGGPYAAGSSSFIGQTLARLGLRNVVPVELGPFPKLNPEFVVRARPDIVMGVQQEQPALLRRPGWSALPALRQRQLCGFPTPQYEMLIRPGPRLGEAARLLADCLARLPVTAGEGR